MFCSDESEAEMEEDGETDTDTTSDSNSKKVVCLAHSVKSVLTGMEANPTPLVRTRGFSTLGGRDKGFTCNLCPDSGATVNVVSEEMVNKRKIAYDKCELDIDLVDASGKRMAIVGIARFFVIPKNNRKKRLLKAVVSSDLVGDPLIGWEQMAEWGLLSKSFPEVVEVEEDEERMFSELGAVTAKVVRDQEGGEKIRNEEGGKGKVQSEEEKRKRGGKGKMKKEEEGKKGAEEKMEKEEDRKKGKTSEKEVGDHERLIEEKVERLEKQLKMQREEKSFLDLEEKMKKKFSRIIRDELIPGQSMKMPPQKLVFKEGVEMIPKNVSKAIVVSKHYTPMEPVASCPAWPG